MTIVQYRDKCRETKDLIRIGTQLHDVCRSHGVPFLVNDRVDVALAIGAEGVHVGQDDIGRTSQSGLQERVLRVSRPQDCPEALGI